MATRDIVPRADSEGSLGTAAKKWANAKLDAATITALTATSIVIGANTITTSEWAYLDGLNQSVTSGASPTFTATNITGVPAASILAGTLGTGAYVFDNTVTGITDLSITGSLLHTGDANTHIAFTPDVITFTYGGVAVTGANITTALDHVTADGSSHGHIDQDVQTSASPTFAGLTVAANIVSEPKHLIFTIINPFAVYDGDTQICVWAQTPAALTVTKIEVTCDADPATEIQGDLKWADAFIGLGNAAVINDFDTTAGVRSDSSISSGSVAGSKCIYIEFDAQPIEAITQINFDVTYDYD